MAVHTLDDGRTYKLDVKPSLPDYRDWRFTPDPSVTIPDDIDIWASPALAGLIKWAYDQGQEGSCTGNAQAKLFRMILKVLGLTDYEVSRAMIYYESRRIEGTTNQDSGSSIGDSMKGLSQSGACSEQMMPYVPGQYTIAPTAADYAEAQNHQLLDYGIVGQTQDQIGAALAMNHPVSTGFVVYSNFNPDANGVIPMPAGGVEGGHNILLTGRILAKRLYIFDNSWGQWGITLSGVPGRAYIPFDYIHNPQLTFETKTMSKVEGVLVPPPPTPSPDEKTKLYQDILRILGPIDSLNVHFKLGDIWPLAIQAPPQ